jgi:hypothetical protein
MVSFLEHVSGTLKRVDHRLHHPFEDIALIAPLLSILADDVSEIGYAPEHYLVYVCVGSDIFMGFSARIGVAFAFAGGCYLITIYNL